MRKLLSQYPRRTTFESTYNFMWCFFWRSLNEQVNMVGLNRQPQNDPSVFSRDFITDFFQTLHHCANQDLLTSFGYPDEVVAHLIDRVVGTFNLACFHVDSLP